MKNSFYFQHDSNSRNDEKLLEVRAEFGVEGYGLYFMLLESMSETSSGYLHFDKIGGLSLGYGVAKGTLLKLVQFCVEIHLFGSDDSCFFSERMVEHLNFRKRLSEAGKRGASKRWKNSPPNSPPNGGGYAKERKGKERKPTGEDLKIFNKLVRWFSEMEDVSSPEKLAEFYFMRNSPAAIDKVLKDSYCTSRVRFSELLGKIKS